MGKNVTFKPLLLIDHLPRIPDSIHHRDTSLFFLSPPLLLFSLSFYSSFLSLFVSSLTLASSSLLLYILFFSPCAQQKERVWRAITPRSVDLHSVVSLSLSLLLSCFSCHSLLSHFPSFFSSFSFSFQLFPLHFVHFSSLEHLFLPALSDFPPRLSFFFCYVFYTLSGASVFSQGDRRE